MAARKFSNRFAKFAPKKRKEYLQALREGNHRMTAARAAGVSYELIRQYRHATEGWAAAEEEAEAEAHGAVEDALFQAAVSGNVTACQVWLYNRRPERWRDRRSLGVGVGTPAHGEPPTGQAQIVLYLPDNGRGPAPG